VQPVNTGIPFRIIQTGRDRNLPTLAQAAAKNLQLLNPGFEYLFFDDQEVVEFVSKNFPEHLRTFHSFPLRIQRYDFFRYLAIYKLGGFYFDLDVLLAKGLSELTSYGCVFPFERLTWADHFRLTENIDWEIGNYAFGAAPGHPFLRLIIDSCVRSQEDATWQRTVTKSLPLFLKSELEAIYTTGPGIATRALIEYRDGSFPVKVLFPADVCEKSSWNMFGSYGVHFGEGSWRRKHGPIRRRFLNICGRRSEARAISIAKRSGSGRPLKNDILKLAT
jgi:inositol phosphorylceramide mannosyltransferase catalytic subunit